MTFERANEQRILARRLYFATETEHETMDRAFDRRSELAIGVL
jgi:hypothetical protein